MLTNLCIRRHGNRFKRPKNPQNDFLTLQQYLDLATYGILRFAGAIAYDMSRNEDAISFIAEKVMLNDWQMNNEKGYSRLAIRIRIIKWSILEYIKLGVQSQYTISFSSLQTNSFGNDPNENTDILLASLARQEFRSKIRQLSAERFTSESDSLENSDCGSVFRDKFERLIYLACLSPKQETCVRLKFKENMSEVEIADELGVTRQAVNLYLQNAYFKLKEVA